MPERTSDFSVKINDIAARIMATRVKMHDVFHVASPKSYEDSVNSIADCMEKNKGLKKTKRKYCVFQKNIGQYYPDYAYEHPLFTDSHKMYSDVKVSLFLKNMMDDQRIEFLNIWNDGRDKDVQIYITYDSTNKNYQTSDIDLAEYGHAKDDKNTPIINHSIGYDHTKQDGILRDRHIQKDKHKDSTAFIQEPG